MKQYAILSLALLLSAPVFCMHPTPIKDSTDSAPASEQVSESFTARHAAGLHTFVSEYVTQEVSKLETTLGTAPATTKDKYPIINQTVKDAKVFADLEAAAAGKEAVEAGRLLQKAAEAHVQEMYAQSGKASIDLGKQLDEQTEKALQYFTSHPAEYESDTEKGLSPENIQLYRFNKYVTSTKQILLDAHPILMAWFKDPENYKALEKLPHFANTLDAHINRIEIWQNQINCKRLTGLEALKTTFKTMSHGITDETAAKISKFEHDISHPAIQFLMVTERLETLLKK